MLEDILMTAIEISLTTSIAIVAVLIISKISEGKFSAKWRYWIWLLIAARLVLPFNIEFPSAPIKVSVPKYEMIVTKTPEENIYEIPAEIPLEETPVQENTVPEENPPKAPVFNPLPEETPAKEEKLSWNFTVLYALGIIWILVGIAVFCYNLFSYLRFVKILSPWNRKVEDEYILELFEEAKIITGTEKDIPLFENRLIKSPMMIGFFSPRVVLPAEELSENEYRMVFRHELTHNRRHDLWYKLLLVLAVSLHWFNPFVKMLCKAAEDDIEISCDEAAVRSEDKAFREEYCQTVLKVMRRGQNAPMVLSTSFYGGAKVLKKRFSAVLNETVRKGTVLMVAAIIITAVCGTLIACSVEEKPEAETKKPSSYGEILGASQKFAEDFFHNIYTEENRSYELALSSEAKTYVEEIIEKTKASDAENGFGKKDYSAEAFHVSGGGADSVAEHIFSVEQKYYYEKFYDPENPDEEKLTTVALPVKITYDSEKHEITDVVIYEITWLEEEFYVPFYVAEPEEEEDLPPVLTGPDEEGYFTAISEEDWDKYVDYNGFSDKKEPEEHIPPFEESLGAMLWMKDQMAGTEWKVIYEEREYTLSRRYDPYSWSYRQMYMPQYFVILEADDAENDLRIIKFTETYLEEYLRNGEIKPRLYGYGEMIPFSSEEFEFGDFSGMEKVNTNGLYFPEKDATLLFDYVSYGAIEVKGKTPDMPLWNFNKADAYATVESDYTRRPDLPENAKNDYIVIFHGGEHVDYIYYYYDYETRELHAMDDGTGYFNMEYINDEIMIVKREKDINIYNFASETPWIPHAVIEAEDLHEGTVNISNYETKIDKVIGGRLIGTFINGPLDSDNDIWMFTFDFDGNVLSNFNLGLKATGYIGSISYHNGLAYFSYHDKVGEEFRTRRFVVDTRPEKDHTLQENNS